MMTLSRKIRLAAFVLIIARGAQAETPARKTAEPLIASAALPQLMPTVKQAHSVGHFHDPFGMVETPGVRVVGQSSLDRKEVLETRLQAVFGKSLQSVVHTKAETGGVILFDGKTFRPGEELFVGPSLTPRPLLEKVRVILFKIQTDALELTVVNLDERRREETVKLALDRQFVP